ncbi:PhoU domain-containing protein [Candidatus Bipolaricaulota bacterium]
MHRRKVQKTGGSTYFVTLPKQWAEEIGIVPGSIVTLMPNDSGTLLLVPDSLSRVNRCTIELQDWDSDRFQREIISRYIVGYDIIEIRRDRIRPEQRRLMREIAQGLVGLEIFDETQEAVVLQAMVNVRDFPVERTLSRIFDITHAMLADAVTAFCGHDKELARDVLERDGDIDRLVLLVARQFNLLLRDLLLEEDVGLSRLEFQHYHTVADQLERVADHAGKISDATLALGGKVLDDVAGDIDQRARDAVSVLGRAVQAFENRDMDLANEILGEKESAEQLFQITRRTATEKQPDAAPSISIVIDSLLRIREYAFNIAEIALDAPSSSNVQGA